MDGAWVLWLWARCAAGLYQAAARGYGTDVGRPVTVTVGGGVHGFPAVLTSFIGRDGPVCEVAGLLEGYRLVSVTGPGRGGEDPAGRPGGPAGGQPVHGRGLAG